MRNKIQPLLFSAFVFVLVLSQIQIAKGQTEQTKAACRLKLDRAKDQFRKGNFYAVEDLVVHCLKKGFSLEEKKEAYELLTITSLYINNDKEAEQYLVALLKLDPFFTADSGIDPDQLVYLYRKYNTEPIAYLGLIGAVNFSQYQSINTVSLSGNGIGFEPEGSSSNSFSIGANFTLPVQRNIHLTGYLQYANLNFNFSDSIYTQFSLQSATQGVRYTTFYDFVEVGSEVELHLSKSKRVIPYIAGGLGASLLLNARLENINRRRNPPGPETVAPSPISVTDNRRLLNPYGSIKAGVKINRPKVSFKIFGGWNQPFLSTTKYDTTEDRFNQRLVGNYGIAGNDYRLSRFYAGLSIQRVYYNFVKKKKYQ